MGSAVLSSTSETEDMGSQSLEAARQRGVYLIKLILLATAGGSLILMCSAVMVGLNSLIGFLIQLRESVGIRAIPGQPDYLVLITIGFLVISVGGGILICLLWYRKAWNDRLKEFWGNSTEDFDNIEDWQQVSLYLPSERKEYIKALLKTNEWSKWYEKEKKKRKDEGDETFPRHYGPETISESDQIDIVAKAIFEKIKSDISEGAFSVGLVVGISRSSFIDRVTIIAAALELQLHVLTCLGKKPSLKVWRELITRTLSSLFFNTYLSREECSEITLLIKAGALGLAEAAELGQETTDDVIDMMTEIDWDGGGGYILGLPLFMAKAAFGIGKAATQVLAQFADRAGDDLMEGILAGGILYYHGATLAAKCLAPDPEELGAPYNLSPIVCVHDGIDQAAAIVQHLLRNKRQQLIDKKKRVVESFKVKYPFLGKMIPPGAPNVSEAKHGQNDKV